MTVLTVLSVWKQSRKEENYEKYIKLFRKEGNA